MDNPLCCCLNGFTRGFWLGAGWKEPAEPVIAKVYGVTGGMAVFGRWTIGIAFVGRFYGLNQDPVVVIMLIDYGERWVGEHVYEL